MALALVLLIGAGIAFASGALDGPGRSGDGAAQPTASPPPPPTLVAPDPALTRLQTIDISGVLPVGLGRPGDYQLRIYVNDRLERERGLPADVNFTVREVGLGEGENEVRATLFDGAREGPPSAPVTVVRDSTPPAIRITMPETGTTVYRATEILRGRTQPGATLELFVVGSGRELQVEVAEDGRFEAQLPLQMGHNVFALNSRDPAGNSASARLRLTRSVTLASLNLIVSATELGLADLPTTIDVVAHVRDEVGRTSDGAEVTFSLSPPNRGTTTYRATTAAGEAAWPDIVVAGDARAIGIWLVTVLVILPSGEELRGDASFSVR